MTNGHMVTCSYEHMVLRSQADLHQRRLSHLMRAFALLHALQLRLQLAECLRRHRRFSQLEFCSRVATAAQMNGEEKSEGLLSLAIELRARRVRMARRGELQ